MKDQANFEPAHTRRAFLTGVTAAAVAGVIPNLSHATSPSGFQDIVANRARLLANGNKRNLRLLMPNGSGENLLPVITAFDNATGISVEMVETPVDDINTQLSLDSMSGEGGYDLALPATFGLPDLVAAGAIVSLSEFAKKHEPKGFRKDVLYDIGDSFDDNLYGFQADGDTYLMFYNRDFLESSDERKRYQDTYSVDLEIPRTWSELDRQMSFFHRPDEDMYGGALFRTPGYLAWEWWVRFHAKGYWPLSESLDPQINSDAGIEALEEMIRATQYLTPEVKSLGLFENWERYSRGDIYCNIGWGGSQKYLNSHKSKMRGRMAYGPTPGGLVDGELLLTPYFNWGWNYVVTSSTQQAELAYLFALFASTPAVSTASVRKQGGYFDPFRPEHYRDPEIQKIYSKEFLAVHEQSLRSSIPDLYLANLSQYFQALGDWLDRALSGSVKPEYALNKVAQQWTLINNRSDQQLQRKRWLSLREKYPDSAKVHLRDLA